jgi:carbonic anhydrase
MCDKCNESQHERIAPSRRSAMLFGASALGLALTGRAFAKETKAPPKPQNVLSPDASLKRLTEGNARYVDGVSRRHDFKHEREALVGGQNPFAAVLC